MNDRRILIVYAVWSALIFALVFAKGGATPDNLTHGLVLVYFAAQLLASRVFAKVLARVPPRRRFVGLTTVLAAGVELLHMISNPLDPSLIITRATPLAEALRSCAIDLVFTLPAYLIIFSYIAYLIGRFRYELWQFVILMALGQALGDGNAFFRAQPALLWMISFIMINYHAMQVVPFLLVSSELAGQEEGWKKYAYALAGLPLVYWCCGAAIKIAGRWLGLLP